MGIQELIPTVENHDGAEPSPQAALAKVEQGLTGAAKEQVKQEPLIGQHQGVQLMRQGEHGVKVGGRQKLCPPGLDPSPLGHRLALGTVAISARVIGRSFKAALGTVVQVSTERGGATGDEIVDEALFNRRYRVRLPIAEAKAAQDIGQLQAGAGVIRRPGQVSLAGLRHKHSLTP
jgi:hypothetical protein